MPKIGLRYTGNDEKEIAKMKQLGGVRYFEPADAREILATPGNEYEPDEESRKLIGQQFNPGAQGLHEGALNIPQLQGEDAELQTGLSHEKYGRSQVVKAVPEPMIPTVGGPQSTTGRPLSLEKAREGDGSVIDARHGSQEGGNAAPRSEGMTRTEIIRELESRNVSFDPQGKKDELAGLLDKQPR